MLLFMADQTGASSAERDWTDEVADRIESAVSSVRDKTTVPIIKAARAVIFGVVAGVLLAGALLLLIIGLVRVLDVYLPFHPRARRVWTVDAVAAAIFLASGVFFWRRSKPRARSD
jgi:hypothetical protein